MPSINVSATKEVLERLRLDLVSSLESSGISVPADAKRPGNCFAAVVAWQRLEHRRLAVVPRRVGESPELRARQLDPAIECAVKAIRSEFERGVDLTQRLTRQFYRAGFNDFLFNNFGIHHLHLGPRGAARDQTRKHPMSGGMSALLFTIVSATDAYFLDVLDHQVFGSVEMAKSLARIALRNRRELLKPYIAAGVVTAEQTFEDAFHLAASGCTTVYELDGTFLLTGGTVLDGCVVDGIRRACTSTGVIDAANRTINLVVDLVEYVQANAESLARLVESDTRVRLNVIDLTVIRAGSVVVLRDESTGVEFLGDRYSRGYRGTSSAGLRQLS